MQVDFDAGMQGAVEVRFLARAQRIHRASQQFRVQREADFLDLSALLVAEQFAGAADLEIVRREREPGAEILERIDRLEPLDRIGRHDGTRRCDQVGIGAMVRAADAAAQLVQLRQAEAVGAIDDDRVGGRHVDAAFDNRRAQQDIEAPVVEIQHDLLELALGHLAVTDANARFRYQLAEPLAHRGRCLRRGCG